MKHLKFRRRQLTPSSLPPNLLGSESGWKYMNTRKYLALGTYQLNVAVVVKFRPRNRFLGRKFQTPAAE